VVLGSSSAAAGSDLPLAAANTSAAGATGGNLTLMRGSSLT
jgi:hypothetical protein